MSLIQGCEPSAQPSTGDCQHDSTTAPHPPPLAPRRSHRTAPRSRSGIFLSWWDITRTASSVSSQLREEDESYTIADWATASHIRIPDDETESCRQLFKLSSLGAVNPTQSVHNRKSHAGIRPRKGREAASRRSLLHLKTRQHSFFLTSTLLTLLLSIFPSVHSQDPANPDVSSAAMSKDAPARLSINLGSGRVQYRGPSDSTQDRTMVARICYKNTDNLEPVEGAIACPADQVSCAVGAAGQCEVISDSRFLEGNTTAIVPSGGEVASFNGVLASLARRDLMLLFYLESAVVGSLDYCTCSKEFRVWPGRPSSIDAVVVPDNPGNCTQCLEGVFAVGEKMVMTASAYDYAGNLVKECQSQCQVRLTASLLQQGTDETVAKLLGGVPIARTGINGIATWPAGTLEILSAGTGYAFRVTNTTESLDTTSNAITMIDLSLRFNPLTQTFIGGTTGDEPGLFLSQPELSSPSSTTDSELFTVSVCYDDTDCLPPLPGLCKCGLRYNVPTSCPPAAQRQVCEYEPRLDDAQKAAEMFLKGNLTKSLEGNRMVPYTDLQITVARSDLRLVFHQVQDGNLTTMAFVSDPFKISSGKLNFTSVMVEPAALQGSNCLRCPPGTHIAGRSISSQVGLFDVFGNRVGYCHSNNIFCNHFQGNQVQVRVFQGDLDVTVNSQTTGITTTTVINGTGIFNDVQIRVSGEYSLRFWVQEATFSPLGVASAGSLVVATTAVFTVVSDSPTSISVLNSDTSILSADSESFPEQPQVELLDQYGNRVDTDCYFDCNCSYPDVPCDTCGTNSTCALLGSEGISVALVTSDTNVEMRGAQTATITGGVARFTDLSVALLPTSDGACGCTSGGSCQTCVSCYGTTGSLPSYQLRFTSTSAGSATRTVQLTRRVQSINIILQDSIQGVALEPFRVPIQIEALDCNSDRVVHTTADITATLKDATSNGQLSPADARSSINDGLAIFTDLQVSAAGLYILDFDYAGNVFVPTTASVQFEVFPSVARLRTEKSPEATTTTAGDPFHIQPQIFLRDIDDNPVIYSSLPLTAVIEDDPGALQAHNPGVSLLIGESVKTASGGKVRYTDLSIDRASLEQGVLNSGFSLRFTYQGISIVSGLFTITPAAWSAILLPDHLQPEQSTAGSLLTVQPKVYLVDEFRNRILVSSIPTGTRVQVSLLVDGQFAVTGNSFDGNPPRLIRSGCDENCVGTRPVICLTCPQFAFEATDSEIVFTDLRIDIASASRKYNLFFNSSSFNTTSRDFAVVNTAAATLSVGPVDTINPAHENLKQQPVVTLVDIYGNPVVLVGFTTPQLVHARLIPPLGIPPALPPLPPVLGQRTGSVCRLFAEPLQGTLSADMSTGVGVFTNLAIRQVRQMYRLEFNYVNPLTGELNSVNSSFIEITPGPPDNLCNMTIQRRCSERSPCLDSADIACVDQYGNVQLDCDLCDDGDLDCSPFSIPQPQATICPAGKVCVELYNSPHAELTSSELCGAGQPCSWLGTATYGALFDDLTFSPASKDNFLRYYTYLHDPANPTTGFIELEYITKAFNVTPPGPRIISVEFTSSVSQLSILFDRKTNRNNMIGTADDGSCDLLLDSSFIRTLGSPSFCSWQTSEILMVSLGSGATVDTSTKVRLLNTSSITFSGVFSGVFMTSLPATTELGVIVNGITNVDIFPNLPAVLPQPVVSISAINNIGACGWITADAGISTGHAGRDFAAVEWTLDLVNSFAEIGIMAAGASNVFLNKHITFSSLYAGERSEVTIRLRPNAPVTPQTVLTISGLPGFVPFASSCYNDLEEEPQEVPCLHDPLLKCIDVLIGGDGASLFYTNINGSTYGQWNGTSLMLVVDRLKNIPAGEDTFVTFNMTNPPGPTLPRQITISGTCAQCICLDRFCTDLKNSHFPVESMFIQCSSKIACQNTVTFGVNQFEVDVTKASIGESTEVSSATNTLTITFRPSIDLPSGSRVIIQGLNGLDKGASSNHVIDPSPCLSGPTAEVFKCTGCRARSEAPAAAFDADAGTLTLTVNNGVRVSRETDSVIRVRLQNPPQLNRELCDAPDKLDCRSVVSPRIHLLAPAAVMGSAPGFPMAVSKPLGILGSGVSPRFDRERCTVAEGNSVRGFVNAIRFQAVANVDMPAGTTLTLSGLVGLDMLEGSLATISISGISSQQLMWGAKLGMAYWNATGSILKTVVSENLVAGELISFGLSGRNPMASQSPKTVLISASFPGCVGCQVSCACISSDRLPLVIPAREMVGTVLSSQNLPSVSVSVSESNGIPGQTNLLTVSVSSPMLLLAGTLLEIGGIKGTQTLDSSGYPISMTSASSTEAYQGIFQITETSVPVGNETALTTAKVSMLLPTEVQSFSLIFEVKNGLTAQSAPTLKAALNGTADVCGNLQGFCVGNLTGLRNPEITLKDLPVSGPILEFTQEAVITKAKIMEQTRVRRSYNIITVIFEANFDLIGNDAGIVVVSGLTGLSYPPTSTSGSIHLRTSMLTLIPNCSCFDAICEAEDSNLCTCTAETVTATLAGTMLWQSGTLNPFGNPSDDLLQTPDSSGTWSIDIGQLSMGVKAGRTIPANQEFVFSFLVQNPAAAQTSLTPTLTLSAAGVTASMEMEGAILAADASSVVDVFTLSEDTHIVADFNTISVGFQLNHNLASWPTEVGQGGALTFNLVTLTIAGMPSFQTSSGYMPLHGPGAYSVAKTGTGMWSFESQQLTLSGGVILGSCSSLESTELCSLQVPGHFDFTASASHSFSFVAKNLLFEQEGLGQISLTTSSPSVGTASSVSTSDNLGDTSGFPAIVSATIMESNNVQASPNIITLEFSLNVEVHKDTMFTLRGAGGVGGLLYSSTNSGELSLSGRHGVNMTGSFDQTTGSVTMTYLSLESIPSSTTLQVEFSLLNPSATVTASQLGLSASISSPPNAAKCDTPGSESVTPGPLSSYGSAIPLTEVILVAAVFAAEVPLEFAVRTIAETTRVSGAANYITVSLRPAFSIPVGGTITMQGLNSKVKARSDLPLFGPDAAIFNSVGNWAFSQSNPIGTLSLSLAQPLSSETIYVFSFYLRNVQSADSDCCTSKSVTIVGAGGPSAAYLSFASTTMHGQILGSGVSPSWITKIVNQTSVVNHASNQVYLTFRPNFPLYGGSKLVFRGLYGSQTRSCPGCRTDSDQPRDRVPGLGCSDDCSECSPEPLFGTTTVFNPCLPVFAPSDLVNRHPKFKVNPRWISEDKMKEPPDPAFPEIPSRGGILELIVEDGQIVSDREDTVVVVILHNGMESQSRIECMRTFSSAQIQEGDCLTLTMDSSEVCSQQDSGFVVGQSCSDLAYPDTFDAPTTSGGVIPTSATGPGHDYYGNTLEDPCGICFRTSDMLTLDNTLRRQSELLLSDIRVATPSLQGLPTLIDGGLQPGTYNIQLALTNWVGLSGASQFILRKASPAPGKGQGPLGNENPIPLMQILGPPRREFFSDESFVLDTKAEPAPCIGGADTQALTFRWTLRCVYGFCETMDAVDFEQGLVPTLLVPAGKLLAGSVYQYNCTVKQISLEARNSVEIHIRFRPLVPLLSGLSHLGVVGIQQDTEVNGQKTYDPDSAATGLQPGDNNIMYQWDCFELLSNCTFEQIDSDSCTQTVSYIPCQGTVLGTTPRMPILGNMDEEEQDLAGFDFGSESIAILNTTDTKADTRYRFRLTASRFPWVIPSLIAENPGQYVSIRQDFEQVATAEIEFTTVSTSPPYVSLTLCDSKHVGTNKLCTIPTTRSRIATNEKIILQADGTSTSGGIVVGYQWQVVSDGHRPLTSDIVFTATNLKLLMIEQGAFNQGHTVVFRCTVSDSNAETGYADIVVDINVPPLAGSIEVEPRNGTALDTIFTVQALDWISDPENLPLNYIFFTISPDDKAVELPLGSTTQTEIQNVLPIGALNLSYALEVGVDIVDNLGDQTRKMTSVNVFPAQADTSAELQALFLASIDTLVDDSMRLGDYSKAQSVIGTIAATVNQGKTPCSATTSEECRLRRSLRTKLFIKLQEVSARVIPNPQLITDQARVLSTIVQRPEDVDFPLAKAATDFLSQSINNAKQLQVDAAALSDEYGSVLEVMLSASAASSQSVLRSRVTDILEDMEVVHVRQSTVTQVEARALRLKILETVSVISSLSVAQNVAGQRPSVITKDAFVVNTSVISRDAFTGFEAELPDFDVSAALPSTIFNNLVLTAEQTSFEVMQTYFFEEQDVLPGALGPVVSVELRHFGSSTPLDIDLPRQAFVKLRLTYTESKIQRIAIASTGQVGVPFGKVFDTASFSWVTDGLTIDGTTDEVVLMSSTHLSHFACGEVLAGCDDVALSPNILDGCGVCGGDDGTCSGCDGIPNTGRDKNCSGHGACASLACACEDEWFGVSCQTKCTEAGNCNGHGACNFETGLDCFCQSQWSSERGLVYPGPFCTIENSTTTGSVGNSDSGFSDDEMNFILTIVVPSVAGGVVFFVCLFYVFTRRRRMEKALRKTIIAFPQPQLDIAAEERPDAMVAIPDESGWTNIKLPKTSADFSYGPNSGQLASAIVASNRASIGQMSTQRIERRTRMMKNTIREKLRHMKYTANGGPPLFTNGDDEDEEDEEGSENGAETAWQISDDPEWVGGGKANGNGEVGV